MTTDMNITLTTQSAKGLSRNSPSVEVKPAITPQTGAAQVTPIRATQSSGPTQPRFPASSGVSKEDMDVAVAQMKDFAQVMSRQLQFDVDDESGATVVRVLDKASGEVIRQIPSEEILALARHMKEMMDTERAMVAGKGVRDKPVGLLMKTQA
jgi:flagellar protein FlaG